MLCPGKPIWQNNAGGPAFHAFEPMKAVGAGIGGRDRMGAAASPCRVFIRTRGGLAVSSRRFYLLARVSRRHPDSITVLPKLETSTNRTASSRHRPYFSAALPSISAVAVPAECPLQTDARVELHERDMPNQLVSVSFLGNTPQFPCLYPISLPAVAMSMVGKMHLDDWQLDGRGNAKHL